jgi:hypothetical protein
MSYVLRCLLPIQYGQMVRSLGPIDVQTSHPDQLGTGTYSPKPILTVSGTTRLPLRVVSGLFVVPTFRPKHGLIGTRASRAIQLA